MSNVVNTISGVLLAIVGVAILAVLVSKNSQTPAVFKSFGDAFSQILKAATGPAL